MATDKPLHLTSDSRALRLSYYSDQTKYVDAVATSASGLTITPTVAGQTITLANTANLSVGGTLAVTGVATLTAGFGTTSGNCYIADTSNADATLALTINQGSADDHILSLKSSDVAHNMTNVAEADTFITCLKISATAGGVQLRGISSSTTAWAVEGTHTTDDTTKTTAGVGAVSLVAALKSGTSVTDCGADANLLTIRNSVTTRFIFDAEGSAHGDVSWVTYDEHDDLAVIEDMESMLAPGRVRRRFGDKHDRAFFEREGLLHDVREESGGTRGMVNTTRATMLAFGAIRQVGGRMAALGEAVRRLVALNPQLAGGARALSLLEA